MDFSTFLESQQAQWPLGKIQALNQTHQIALGSPLSHPLQSSELLHTTSFIQLTIGKPKAYSLSLAEVRDYMNKIVSTAPDDVVFGLNVESSETLEDAISVRILVAQAD